MNEVSPKPVIEELENLFSKFNARFFDGGLEKPVITVSPDHTRGAKSKMVYQAPENQSNQQVFGRFAEPIQHDSDYWPCR